jgi:hypothetical protein
MSVCPRQGRERVFTDVESGHETLTVSPLTSRSQTLRRNSGAHCGGMSNPRRLTATLPEKVAQFRN